MNAEPQLLDARAAAAYLGIPVSTLRRETQRGNLPAKCIGMKRWYHRLVLDNYAKGAPGEHSGTEAGGQVLSLRRRD